MSDQTSPPPPGRKPDDETAELTEATDGVTTSNTQSSPEGTALTETAAAGDVPVKKAAPKKAAPKKAPAKKAPAKKAPAKKAPAKKAAAKKAPAKKAPAKKAPAKKAPAKKAPAKKTPAKKTPAKKTPTQKSPAKKAPAKSAAPVTVEPGTAAAAAAPTKKAPAKKAPARKIPAQSAAAKKAAARKVAEPQVGPVGEELTNSAGDTETTALRSTVTAVSPKPSAARPDSVARPVKAPAASAPTSHRTAVAAAVAALVLVAGAVVGWFGLQHFLGESTDDNRTEAVGAATTAAETIFSFSFDDLDNHTAESKALMTPAYAKQFDQIAPALTDIAPQREVVVEAVTRNAAVLPCGDECSDTKTSVLVFVDLDRRTQEDESSTVFGNRIVVDLVKSDGDWKVGDIRAL